MKASAHCSAAPALTRRRFLQASAASAAALALSPLAVAQQLGGGRKPNIVVIMADDLGYGDAGCYGGSFATPTPHIDRLAAEGTRFTDAYVTAPVCGPSRAGFMTGRYQNRFGMEVNYHEGQYIPDGEPTIGLSLKEAGYTNGVVGKWHLGFEHNSHPFDRGFDEYFGAPQWTHYLPQNAGEPLTLYRGKEKVQETQYITDAYTREAIDFIERHKDGPFFLFLSHWAVHRPNEASQKYLDRFMHIPQSEDVDSARGSRRIHHAMVSALDDSVGQVMAALEAQGVADNTLVIFLSDNGAPTPENRGSNGPLRGYKKDLWEGGIRTPFIVRWPGRVAAGRVSREPIIALDIFPTLLEATGGRQPAKALDGRSLWPILRPDGVADPQFDRTLFWKFGDQIAAREGQWKYLRFADNVDRLYNLWEDPFETRHPYAKSDRNEQAKERLRQAAEAWAAQMPPRMGGENPRPLSDSRP